MKEKPLTLDVKKKMIEYLNLAPLTAEEIINDAPLFGEGLGLDSIDSLELIVMLKREYGITIHDPKDGRKILVNVDTMVDYIEKHRTLNPD